MLRRDGTDSELWQRSTYDVTFYVDSWIIYLKTWQCRSSGSACDGAQSLTLDSCFSRVSLTSSCQTILLSGSTSIRSQVLNSSVKQAKTL